MSENFKYTNRVLLNPICLVLLLWLVYWVEIKFGFYFNSFGIYPLKLTGLKGIVFSPFIHGSLEHLFNNTFPLLLLSMALYYFYPKVSNRIILYGIVLSGMITWLIGRPNFHIGASGLVYVLASFLFFKGIFSKYYRLVALSLSIVFIYGSLIWGLFPIKSGVSWEGHLSGFIVGLGFALYYKTEYKLKKYKWEKSDYKPEEDEFMQQFDEDGNFNPERLENKEDDKNETKIIYHYRENDEF